jgi:hypothetical protein
MAATRLPTTALPAQPEADFMKAVLAYATLMGWHHWHDTATNAPRRCWHCGRGTRIQRNPSGFPDLVLIRRPRLLFVELKRDGEKPDPAQVAWHEQLRACSQQVYLWRPSDWREIERMLR